MNNQFARDDQGYRDRQDYDRWERSRSPEGEWTGRQAEGSPGLFIAYTIHV